MQLQKNFYIGLIALSCGLLSNSCKMRDMLGSKLEGTKSDDIPADLDGKVAQLTGAKDAIPPLFQEATTHKVDMFVLMDEQKELLQTLEAEPTYQQQTKARLDQGDLLGIDVRIQGITSVVQRRLDPAAVAGWTQRMVTVLDKVIGHKKANEPIGPSIAKFAAINLSAAQEFAPLITGAILGAKNLVAEERAAILKLPLRAKMTRFRNEGKAWDLSGFDVKRFSSVGSLDRLAPTLENDFTASENFTLAAEMHILLQQNDQGLIDERIDTLKERLQAASEGDLDLFVDKKAFAKRFAVFMAQAGLEEKRSEDSKKLIDTSIKEVSSATITEQVKVEGVQLEESDHNLAMLRGMAAGDCSSEYSAGFTALPKEYVFYVYEESGRLLGFAQATLVRDRETKAIKLFFHTNSGKRLLTSHSYSVFEAMRTVIPKIGATGMLIPVDKAAIFQFNNFAAPRAVFEAMLATRAKGVVEVEYLDADLRAKVHEVNDGSYDMPDHNRRAMEIDISQSFVAAAATTNIRPSTLLKIKPRTPSSAEKVMLVLDLIKIGASREAEQIAEQTGASIDQYRKVDAVFRNEKMRSIDVYKASVLDAFRSVGLQGVDEKVFSDHGYFFSLGWMRAPDAFNALNISRSMDLFLEEIRINRKEVPELGDEVYKKNAAAMSTHPKLANYVRGMSVADADDRKLFDELFTKFGAGTWTAPWEQTAAQVLGDETIDPIGRIAAADILARAKSSDPVLRQAMAATIIKDQSSPLLRRSLVEALGKTQHPEPFVVDSMLRVLQGDRAPTVRIAAAAFFSNHQGDLSDVQNAQLKTVAAGESDPTVKVFLDLPPSWMGNVAGGGDGRNFSGSTCEGVRDHAVSVTRPITP